MPLALAAEDRKIARFPTILTQAPERPNTAPGSRFDMTPTRWIAIALVTALAATAVLAQTATPPEPVLVPERGQLERQVPESRAQVQLSFAPVVREVVPSVVNVYAT